MNRNATSYSGVSKELTLECPSECGGGGGGGGGDSLNVLLTRHIIFQSWHQLGLESCSLRRHQATGGNCLVSSPRKTNLKPETH
jgi:hypothetical protein